MRRCGLAADLRRRPGRHANGGIIPCNQHAIARTVWLVNTGWCAITERPAHGETPERGERQQAMGASCAAMLTTLGGEGERGERSRS